LNKNMIDNRNLFLAVALSLAILLVSQFYFDMTRPPPPEDAKKTEQSAKAPGKSQPGAQPGAPAATPGASVPSPTGQTTHAAPPSAPGSAAAQPTSATTRAAVLAAGSRVKIATPRVTGSISLKGGIVDDVVLSDYRETIDPKSPAIVLMQPKGLNDAYYAQFGWVPQGNVTVPGPDTMWSADRGTLTPDQPVTLSWANGQGLTFKRTYAIDKNYMITVTQEVVNATQAPISLHAYGLISRRTTPQTTGFYILHEGLLGVFDNTLKEVDYDELQKAGQIKQSSKGGWIGITDKYWLAALVPDQTTPVNSRFYHSKPDNVDTYQVDYVGPALTAPPGQPIKAVTNMFVGAKQVRLLDAYEEKLGVARFDLAIDFGWFYFLTKPIFYALLWLEAHVANLGIAILLLTVGIKLAFFPLANKSYVSMSKMKKLQPKMVQLKERFGEDRQRLNQEMMELYKKEKVNPASGCLPILVQIPVFFALYKVLFVTIEMRHAPFYGWIHDLSAPDPTTLFNLFGLIDWTPPHFLMIGVWPLIMGVTMFLQQKLNPQPADPVQAKIFMFLPLFFTFLLASFPAGLVIYWAWNNLLSIIQQWIIMRRQGLTGKEALQ
jgi:YidC/Oxa1 family membrane protein insertase